MADEIVELKKKVSTLEKIINNFNKHIIQQSKQLSSLNAKNRNLEMKVDSLIKLVNRDRG
jgi:uncharacterized coiled-coil DUF342 family protein